MADGKNDEGIKISAPYYDVNTAGDINLIFSSSWPSLAVAFQKTFSILSTDYPKVIPHGLGFPPLAMGWFQDPSNNHVTPHFTIHVDKTNIYIYNDIGALGTNGKYCIVAYSVDLSQKKDYPFIQQPQGSAGSTYDPNYGIKLAKEGFDANDTDLRNFIIHSRCRSPLLLHQDAVNSAVATTLRYTNPQNYVPWVFGFGGGQVSGQDTYQYAIVGSQAYPRLGIDPSTGEMSVANNPGHGNVASLVVLRDPLFAGTQVNVTY